MEVKTTLLTGHALDWVIAKCEGKAIVWQGSCFTAFTKDPDDEQVLYSPSTDWAQGSPIIEHEQIEVVRGNDILFTHPNERGERYEKLYLASSKTVLRVHGSTPLISAMRCYAATKLGEVVDIPDSLLEDTPQQSRAPRL